MIQGQEEEKGECQVDVPSSRVNSLWNYFTSPTNNFAYINGHVFEQTLGDSEGQGSLVYCPPWGHK